MPRSKNAPVKCPLCHGSAQTFYKNSFYRCKNCTGIFRAREKRLTPKQEKERYDLHNNDVFDERYQQFVSPIVEAVKNNYEPKAHGLDFGCGPGPVISKLLTDNNYQISQYDPFYAPNEDLLQQKFDYIVCCEVIEHFRNPNQEFSTLVDLLKSDGHLYCMTDLYEDNKKFKNWGYKDDQTHLFFYTKQSLNWIKKNFGFSSLFINDRLVIFTN
jgi:SAM-dependent methyltransferase